MPYGYNGKILHVNLNSLSYEIEQPDEKFYRTYLGGKGFVAYYLFKNVKPGADPLGPDNILVVAAGPLTGTPGPGLNRYSVGAKSPLSGVYGDAEAGGWWGPELKFAGWDAIILHGRATHPVYVWIDDGKVEIRDARHLWGRTTGEAQDAIRADVSGENSRKVRVLGIGPAGENMVRYALLLNELRHFNGRGGMGAVMGSKNVKAVAVRGSNPPDLADPDTVMELVKWHAKNFKDDPRGGALFNAGTPGLITPLQAAGLLPTHNFRSGSFDLWQNINYDAYKAQILHATGTCFACPVRCKREAKVDDDEYQVDPRYGGPEYETMGAFGPGVEVGDLRPIAAASQYCAAYGLDSISAGASIQWAMECYEHGLLTKEDTGGLELRFGDEKMVLRLLDMIAHRQGFGDLLADGVKRAAEKIGRGTEQYAMHVKGQELPMHEPRGKFNVGLGYAVSETGADHLRMAHDSSFTVAESAPMKSMSPLGIFDPIDPLAATPDKVRFYAMAELTSQLMNTIGGCFFVYSPRGFFPLEKFVTMTRAITGWDTSLFDLLKTSERVINLARAFNLREGLRRADDTLPERFFGPLQGGRLEGASIKRADLENALTLFYQMRGWDPATSLPTAGKLAELGLGFVAPELGVQ